MKQVNRVLFAILMVALIFSFGLNKSVSQVTDIDGNVYKTVIIGTQEWMAENLNVKHYRNGDIIPNVKDRNEWSKITTGAWCYYDNEQDKGIIYGKLYKGFTINDPRGLAPDGWHIPSDAEWTILTDFLGGEKAAYEKLESITFPESTWPVSKPTNESGFTALPGGYRILGYLSFYELGMAGYFWSSTDESDTNSAWVRKLQYNVTRVQRVGGYKGWGLSVRCIKD